MNIDADKQAATPDCDCRGEGETKKLNTATKNTFPLLFLWVVPLNTKCITPLVH